MFGTDGLHVHGDAQDFLGQSLHDKYGEAPVDPCAVGGGGGAVRITLGRFLARAHALLYIPETLGRFTVSGQAVPDAVPTLTSRFVISGEATPIVPVSGHGILVSGQAVDPAGEVTGRFLISGTLEPSGVIFGYGHPSTQPMTLDAAGLSNEFSLSFGVAPLTLQTMNIGGVGLLNPTTGPTGVGALTLGNMFTTGHGTRPGLDVHGVGVLTAESMDAVAGAGLFNVFGVFCGRGVLATEPMDVGTGAGLFNVLGVFCGIGNLTDVAMTIDGVGDVNNPGIGELILEAMTCSGQGIVHRIGSGDLLLSAMTSSGVGVRPVAGSGNLKIGGDPTNPMFITAAGTFEPVNTGSGDLAMQPMEIEGEGRGISGGGDLVNQPMTCDGVGELSFGDDPLSLNSAHGTVSYSASGVDWPVPDGVVVVWVQTYGGGGQSSNPLFVGSCGGGGGGYSERFVGLVPGATYNVNDNYTTCADFDDGVTTLVKAMHGGTPSGDTPGVGGQAASGIGTIKFSGGDGGLRCPSGETGGGGGGAAGPDGDGGDGADGTDTIPGDPGLGGGGDAGDGGGPGQDDGDDYGGGAGGGNSADVGGSGGGLWLTKLTW